MPADTPAGSAPPGEGSLPGSPGEADILGQAGNRKDSTTVIGQPSDTGGRDEAAGSGVAGSSANGGGAGAAERQDPGAGNGGDAGAAERQDAVNGGDAAGRRDGGAAKRQGGSAPTATRTGRNLPAALGVGLGMGGLALVTLFTVKATFLAYLGAVAGIGLWELSRAVQAHQIRLPLLPVAAGGVAAVTLAYWQGERALLACVAVTVVVILGWRLPGGASGYLRDVTAGVFALIYVPLMASFVALMLSAPDGPQRTLVFVILTVCSDIGGYAAGSLIGRHKMAPVISPNKTWEGFAGSVVACLAAGAITLPTLLSGEAWQGVLVGAAALAAATLGDLAASMAKRDLQIKDWGGVLPGHGGALDRIDSLLISAPVVWLLLTVFIRP